MKPHYYVSITKLSFYDSSPFTSMPDILLGPFKTKRNAKLADGNFGFDPEIEGLLGYNPQLIKSKEVLNEFYSNQEQTTTNFRV